jgi:hypothetical protein
MLAVALDFIVYFLSIKSETIPLTLPKLLFHIVPAPSAQAKVS